MHTLSPTSTACSSSATAIEEAAPCFSGRGWPGEHIWSPGAPSARALLSQATKWKQAASEASKQGMVLEELLIAITSIRYSEDSKSADVSKKMKEYSVDMNWRRLWAANGNDDGDELTTEIQDPGLLGTGTCLGSFSAHRLSPLIAMQTHALFASFIARARAFERANHRDYRDAGWRQKRAAAEHWCSVQVPSPRLAHGCRRALSNYHQEPPGPQS